MCNWIFRIDKNESGEINGEINGEITEEEFSILAVLKVSSRIPQKSPVGKLMITFHCRKKPEWITEKNPNELQKKTRILIEINYNKC